MLYQTKQENKLPTVFIEGYYRFYFFSREETRKHVHVISPNGIWILTNDKEYFISYRDYPVFETASIRQIANITTDFSGNLHWEELDADIEIAALENPKIIL